MEIDSKINELEELAGQDRVIYDICFRRAGWGIKWYEQERRKNSTRWEDGLIIYGYYSTFSEMINKEIERLSKNK